MPPELLQPAQSDRDVSELFVTLREAAMQLRMSERSLRRRIRAGQIKVSRHGRGPMLLHRDEFYAAIEKRRRGEI